MHHFADPDATDHAPPATLPSFPVRVKQDELRPSDHH